jgi:HEAT repeat protein
MKTLVLAGLCALTLAAALQDDPIKNLKSKDVSARLTALEALSKEKNAKNEKAVLGALKDEDWEVVEKAADVLAKIGTEGAVDELVKLALTAPLARLRAAAATALAVIDPVQGAEGLSKKVASPDPARALESLAVLAAHSNKELDLKALDKLPEKAKEPSSRAAAARALTLAAAPDKTELLKKLATSAHPEVACAVLDAAIEKPSPARAEALASVLAQTALLDVVERRAVRALAAALAAAVNPAEAAQAAQKLLPPLLGAKEARVAARGVQVLSELARRAPPPLEPATLLGLVRPALAHASADVRAQAACALAFVKGDEAWKEAQGVCRGDKEARVRRAALIALVRLAGAREEKTRAELIERLAADASADVRLAAATELGVKANSDAALALEKALADKDWRVAACAAVSLGKLQTEGAVTKLGPLAKSAPDWKLRGAAVEGLAQTFRKECVPAIIAVVGDPDPTVQKTAHMFLCALAKQTLPPKPEPWNEWWAKNGAKVELVDPHKEPSTPAPSDEGTRAPVVDFTVWRGLDVLVLETRSGGDHIQSVLERQKLEHRKTLAGKIGESGLHPAAVFVANCPGEIEAVDVERIQWFVLCGGRLFGSCWALTETIARSFPGVIQKAETASEVIDMVPASDWARASPYNAGVFLPGVEPEFALEGAHLIEVLAPERCEVLMDSPLCAEAWASGTLAILFQEGHGTVVDSVNHFEAQGFEHVEGLKTPEARQAWAVDHMGYPLDELRKTRHEKWWDNAVRASENVQDLLVFRLVTNVVKLERGLR